MTRPRLILGDTRVSIRDIVRACDEDWQATLTDAARAKVVAARAVVDAYAAGSEPIYGLNTGLGGNVGYRLDPKTITAFQVQMVRGRNVGIGPPFDVGVARAQLLCRIVGLARAGAGISPTVLDLMIAMFNAGVTPLIPARGSIGAGDLGLCGHLAAVVIGRGQAWFGGRLLSGAEALAAAGLAPATLGPKDGLSLLNASAVTCGHAVRVLADLANVLTMAVVAAALACEGYAANRAIFDARVATARPARGQAEAAAMFRKLLAGSYVDTPGAARMIQDALSFRVLPQIVGPALEAFRTAVEELETEVNAAADSPLVLVEERVMLSTANFHTPSIALAFDTLAIVLCHLATASAQRTIKLMTPHLSGLARFLSPIGGASNGLVTLQKTVAHLHAEVRLRATPASLDAIVVSEAVEDVAPQTPLTVRKLEEQLVPLRMIVAIEALTAAQAVDVRGVTQLARATRILHDAIRARVPMLREDREGGLDANAVLDVIADTALAATLRRQFAGLDLPSLLAA